MTITDASPGDAEIRIDLRTPRQGADLAFRIGLVACASAVLAIVAAIIIFLLARSGPAWGKQHLRLFTSAAWNPAGGSFGFKGALVGSLVIASVALVIATPISLATALAINEFVPRRLRSPLIALVDLLAALPSLVYGFWGKAFLGPKIRSTTVWLSHHATFFPLFRVAGEQLGNSLFLAGLIVSIMILPLMTAISREVMSQVPREHCEAALALGGTRWGMITDVILPFSRNGIVGGAMLGLGRALGETIAVSLVLLGDQHLTSHILQPGGGDVAALIVTNFMGGSDLERSALVIAGLTLFSVTLAVNLAAGALVAKTGQGARR